MEKLIDFSYIIASILFILGIKMLGSARTARKGNMISAIGMLLAVVVTLLDQSIIAPQYIVIGLIIGSLIGIAAARFISMEGLPELVALFNGFGGLASVLVAAAEYSSIRALSWPRYLEINAGYEWFWAGAIVVTMVIGAITFTGSLIAYLKLSGKLGGSPFLFPMQKFINGIIALALIAAGVFFTLEPDHEQAKFIFLTVGGAAFLLGILAVLPIGGGDMPVVIAFLNSCSGLAASAAGFVINNNVLIVAGCLVGASGLILTGIMCKAMNRSFANVLFGGFGATGSGGGGEIEGEMKALSVEDAYYVLEAAQNVVFIPGYGMAVAQAQHAVKELADILSENGAQVRHAVHSVAGRMPGHMNVLLAEADVPYEDLFETDDVNPTMSTVDVAIVIGANDVVNPAALTDETCAIYGMPIIRAHEARTVFVLKRGQGMGFSQLVNTLFFKPNVRMIYGDAKQTITGLIAQFKDA